MEFMETKKEITGTRNSGKTNKVIFSKEASSH